MKNISTTNFLPEKVQIKLTAHKFQKTMNLLIMSTNSSTSFRSLNETTVNTGYGWLGSSGN